MKSNKLMVLLVSLLLLTAAATVLFAQTSGTGAIAGTVTDSTGAVIPGATVVAVNADTGQQRTVTTGANGGYQFSLLPPGAYNLKFSANGFKVTEVSRLQVAVSETPVMNQKLDLGTQSEQVTVEANAEAIQTSNAALGTVVGGTALTAIPLTSRNYTNILALSAGVAAGVTNAATLGKGGLDFQVNGVGIGSNNIQIDGANVASMNGYGRNADSFSGTGNSPVPNPDSLQEFKIQTSSYDAGFGRNAGANVNVVTKTGTNVYHGSAFEFFRNTVLNANDFFLNRSGTPKGLVNQNQFGGSVGGPIKKDKIFFFASYQGTVQKNGLTSSGNTSLNLPPLGQGPRENRAAFQAAVGAAFCPANHGNATAYQTLRGGVQVACDGSNINPVALNLLQFKKANGAYLLPGSPTNEFVATNVSDPARYREDQGLGNIDYLLSSKHTVALKYFNSYAPITLPFPSATHVPGFTSFVLIHETTWLTKLTSVLTPNIVNEARLSYHRDLSNNPGNNSGLSSAQFGITPLSPAQDAVLKGFLANMTIAGAYTFGAAGGQHYNYSTSHAFQASEQISWTHGKHTVRAGVDLEQARWFRNYLGSGSGAISISTFADFLIGRAGCTPGDTACTPSTPTLTNGQPNNGTVFTNMGSSTANANTLGSGGNSHSYRENNNAAFVNDDIKVTRSLTVNLGLRYEFLGVAYDILGNYTGVWPSAILKVAVPGNSVETGTLAGWVVPANFRGTMDPGLTRASNNNSLEGGPPKDNFAPRIGFAWQPIGGSKVVVRGGYGYFFDRVVGTDMITGVNNGPPLAPANYFAANQSGYASTLQQPYKIQATNTFLNGVRWVDFTTGATSGIGQRMYTANHKTPLIQEYNLNVQYNFRPTWVLEVGYVGSHGINLEQTYNPNSSRIASIAHPYWGVTTNTVQNTSIRVPYLGFAAWTNAVTEFTSKYNSLQATLRKQFSHGFSAQAAYTYSRGWGTNIQPNYVGELYREYSVGGGGGGMQQVPNRPQRLVVNYNWNLPFGNPKGILGKLVTGWNLSGVTIIQTGAFITITDGRGGTIYGLTSSRAQILGSKTYGDIPTPGDVISRLGGQSGGCGYFTSPTATGTLDGTITCKSLSPFTTLPIYVDPDGRTTNGTYQGNMGSSVIRGPDQVNFDASLAKTTKVGGVREDATLQFRWELFNMFNHAQFSDPNSTVSSANFGQITGTTNSPRVMQLALKYIF